MLGFVDICSVPSPSSWMFLAAPPTNLKIVAQRWSRNTKFVGSSMWRAGFLTPAWRRYKEVLEDPFCGKRMKKSQSSSISSLTSKYINLWYIHLSGTYGTSSHYSSSILMHPAICMVDFGRLDFLGAPPQSSLRPGYRNRGLVCRGCRTWCSSHMPSETAGNSKSGRLTSLIIPKFTGFTGWHSLLESNWTKWRHLHGHTFIKPLSSTTWCRQKLTPSRLFRGLTVLHHFGFQIGQPHVDSCGYRCCANDSSWLDPPNLPYFRRCLLVLVHQINDCPPHWDIINKSQHNKRPRSQFSKYHLAKARPLMLGWNKTPRSEKHPKVSCILFWIRRWFVARNTTSGCGSTFWAVSPSWLKYAWWSDRPSQVLKSHKLSSFFH